VTVLGSAACTLLGIAVSSLAKNGRSASAMVTPIALVLQFISGVFFQFSQVPVWMQTVAAFFPLKWMAQGLRSVFLPDALAAQEPAGSWELGRVALVLGLWCIAGLLLCVATFRWQDRGAA
jgi:ABC-2 type transport system permease protein